MGKSKTMSVTKNVSYCLDTLKKAVAKMPAGDEKTEATNAIKYLIDTAKGKAQIQRGKDCNWKLIIPHWKLEKTSKFYKPKS
jgi:hypothetical protein